MPMRGDLEAVLRLAAGALDEAQRNGWDPGSGETVEDYYDRVMPDMEV